MEIINSLVQSIKSSEVQIQEMGQRCKDTFNEITLKFVESNNIRTSEIDQLYKQNEATFNAKAKLEAKVREQKKEILKILLE